MIFGTGKFIRYCIFCKGKCKYLCLKIVMVSFTKLNILFVFDQLERTVDNLLERQVYFACRVAVQVGMIKTNVAILYSTVPNALHCLTQSVLIRTIFTVARTLRTPTTFALFQFCFFSLKDNICGHLPTKILFC
jgi:hypothetical protein